MEPEQIYISLKELAEKLNITVSEKNLQNTGVKVKSGLCRIKEKQLFVMDKHKPLKEKIEILATCLSSMSTEETYLVPAVRETIEMYKKG